MDVKVLCFDFGNTLIENPFENVMKYQSKRFEELLRKYGYDIDREEIIYSWRAADSKIHYPFISHFFQERKIVENMLERLGVVDNRSRIVSELITLYRNGLMVAIRNDPRIKGVRVILERIRNRGKIMAVLSSERTNSLNTMLSWAGMSQYFKKIIATEAIGVDKPDPNIFWFLLKSLNAGKDDVAYIGDSYYNDIMPAKKFGIKAIWLRKRDEKMDSKYRPDAVIRDLSEVLNLIE